jgi:hypothetical protein
VLAPPPIIGLPAPPGVNHGAAILALAAPRLLACWYSGRSEAGADAVIVCTRSADAGATWSPPVTVSRPGERDLGGARPAKSVGNVVLTRDRTGRVVMIAGEVQSRRVMGLESCRSWRCGRISFRISIDDGASWSPPTRLDDRPGALPRSGVRTGPAGDLLPVYREGRGSSVLRLDLATLASGRPSAVQVQPIPASQDLLQPTLADVAGRATAFLRDRRRRAVYATEFDPAAGVWRAAVPTDLPNPGSAVEAFDFGDKAGLIYNPSRRDRRALGIAFTADGRTFPYGCELIPQDAAGEVAYPSATPLGDGLAVILSTHGKHGVAVARLARPFLDACAAQLRPDQAANMSSKLRR